MHDYEFRWMHEVGYVSLILLCKDEKEAIAEAVSVGFKPFKWWNPRTWKSRIYKTQTLY